MFSPRCCSARIPWGRRWDDTSFISAPNEELGESGDRRGGRRRGEGDDAWKGRGRKAIGRKSREGKWKGVGREVFFKIDKKRWLAEHVVGPLVIILLLPKASTF